MEKSTSILSDDDLVYDGGEYVVACSNCRQPLLKVVVSRPKNKLETQLKALCPYCGDGSFKKRILGVYLMGSADDKLDVIDVEMIKCCEEDGIIKQEILIKLQEN